MAREVVKIVIIGHVDHGKSTLIGRLLVDTNSLPKERLVEIKRISRELGRDTELAYITDQLKEERDKNITIDTTQIFFKTRKREYVIIDAPGHVEFIKNMITGASLADAACLLVDIAEGIKEQTRRHAYLIKMIGLKNIIVLFNKMDLINYEEGRFNEVKESLLIFFDKLGLKPHFLIPISAKEGGNVTKKAKEMNWYNGLTFLEALDSMRIVSRGEERAMRFPIQDVYDIDGERIVVGRLSSGILREGEEVVLLPEMVHGSIEEIRVFGKRLKKADPGESIGIVLDGLSKAKRGDMLVEKGKCEEPATSFRGDIFWMSEKPMKLKKTMTFRCATQETSCVVERIEKRIDSSTLKVLEENASELKTNEVGEVRIITAKPVVVESFSRMAELGKFVLEEGYVIKGAGIVTLDESNR